MITQIEHEAAPLWVEALKPREFAAGLPEVVQLIPPQAERSDAIEEQAHGDAAPGGFGQRAQKPQPGLVAPPEIELDMHMMFCLLDPLFELGVELLGIEQDAQRLGVASSVALAGVCCREGHAENRVRCLSRRRLSRSVPKRQ